jgi:hydroxymethylglutaryl-CoA reductase (NADPH)
MSVEQKREGLFSVRLLTRLRELGGMAAAPALSRRLEPVHEDAGRFHVRRQADSSSIRAWWASKGRDPAPAIASASCLEDAEAFGSSIENMIGVMRMPIGVAGPLRVNGLHASGEYMVPLATTEAALVASYARGAHVITRSGGASAAVLSEIVVRSPAFVFRDMMQAGSFVAWVVENEELLRTSAEATTRHGRLEEVDPYIENDVVFLVCRFSTGDAAGQNMVTIATEAMCRAISAVTPIQPLHWFVEGNFSGDKKASYLGLLTGRGRKASASVTIPDAIVERCLRVTPERMLDYARVAQLGALLSGQIGAQGHYANGLAAFYLATGQDAACVAESAVGFTRMERREGGLFMSVTMPNILVGSVGGGTSLPTQSACLDLMGLKGDGCATALAEVCASICLAGEISIMAAIAAGEFTRSHDRLARRR